MTHSTTWIEISRSALNHNIALFKKRVGASALLAVIKSNAYGHDMLAIARLCQENPAIAGFVAVSLSESYRLRQEGITKPILVMGYYDQDLSYALAHGVELSVVDYATLEIVQDLAQRHKKPFPVHIKIDTGLTRFGFTPEHTVDLVKRLQSNRHLKIAGLCTHFAESSSQDWLFTAQQRLKFTHVVTALAQQSILPPLCHADKSSTALRDVSCGGNGIRLGAGLYGLLPGHGLRQVMSWKTRIVHIRTADADVPIGYGRTYCTRVPTRIAFVPVGYYDGYDRRLSNCGSALVAYRTNTGVLTKASISVIGRITMNSIAFDVSHLADVKLGDEVELLGEHPAITASTIARLTGGENPRDVTVKVGAHIPRVVVP